MAADILTLVCAAVLSAGCGESTVTTSTADQPGPASAPAKSTSHVATYVHEYSYGSTFVARIEGTVA